MDQIKIKPMHQRVSASSMTSISSGSLAVEHDPKFLDQSQQQPTQAAPKYEYKPLHESQIRLLTITSIGNDGIACGLEPSEFGHSPTYDALSYAWGEQDSNRPTLRCVIAASQYPLI